MIKRNLSRLSGIGAQFERIWANFERNWADEVKVERNLREIWAKSERKGGVASLGHASPDIKTEQIEDSFSLLVSYSYIEYPPCNCTSAFYSSEYKQISSSYVFVEKVRQ